MSFTRPIMIGISGPSASGKTTVAERIQKQYENECLILSADRYYAPIHLPTVKERAATTKDHPIAIDFELLVKHVSQLINGETIEVPSWNFTTHERYPTTETINPAGMKYIVVESILVFCNDDLVKLFDRKIFVNTDLDICLSRRIKRDVKERGREAGGVIDQYLDTVKPALVDHILPSKKHADLTITNNKTVDSADEAEIDMRSVYELIEKPIVRGKPSNTGMFAYDPFIHHPAAIEVNASLLTLRQ